MIVDELRIVGSTQTNVVMIAELTRIAKRALRKRPPNPRKEGLGQLVMPFDRDLAWGPRGLVGLTVFDTVVLTPVFEEGVFRGLLFATLRRRFGLAASATLTAAVLTIGLVWCELPV